MMPVKISTVFCDDIRVEQTGKLILVGVYPADLVPGSMPSTFPLAMLVQIEGLSVGQHQFHLRMKSPSGNGILEQSDEFTHFNERKPTVLIFAGVMTMIDSYGEIVVELDIDGQHYRAGHLTVSASGDAQPA